MKVADSLKRTCAVFGRISSVYLLLKGGGNVKTYETRAMDTWDIIAKRVYGSEALMDQLIRANLQHRKTAFFSAGVVLNVPDIDTDSMEFAENLPPWKRQEGTR
jgi:phage tail protein X|nr:MAG TPA: tail protein [Bacteriophage sp.]DAM51324.1 MAG TPA: tail protein [Caudoviricetes sp.]DAR41578.1 MAG TPA: tail protein [Caudoviricetes sp.]DAY71393.1 MAG TPA: tail protein [Caudoviricetes sp.]DAY76867.1 MAG TPA: tail protein [Caudoviricetes sp.]